MALLRNRLVNLVGPNGPDVSPSWTVQYPDGTREDTPLKNIQLSDSELKDFEKQHGKQLSLHVRPIADKEHQDVVDSQNAVKIHERVKKGELNRSNQMVQVPSYVKASDLDKAKPQVTVEPIKSVPPVQSKTLPNQVR